MKWLTVFVLLVLLGLLFTQQLHAETVPKPSTELMPLATNTSEIASKVGVSGVIQTSFSQRFDSNNDGKVSISRFRIRRARITLRGDVNPSISYDVMLDPRSRDITRTLRDAFLDVKAVVPHHTLRIGQQKTQFGYENGRSSTRLYTINRRDVSVNFARGDATLRDIGVGLLGNWQITEAFRLDDAITLVNGAGMNQSDDTKRKNLWGRVGVRYKGRGVVARLGVSAANGDVLDTGDDPLDPADDFIVTFNRLGTDVRLNHNRFRVEAEYVRGQDIDVDGEPVDLSGYYLTLIGKTPWRIGPVVRYDTTDDDGDIYVRWTFGAFYGRPSEEFRVILNYERQEDRVELDDGSIEVTRGDDRLYVRTQVRF